MKEPLVFVVEDGLPTCNGPAEHGLGRPEPVRKISGGASSVQDAHVNGVLALVFGARRAQGTSPLACAQV